MPKKSEFGTTTTPEHDYEYYYDPCRDYDPYDEYCALYSDTSVPNIDPTGNFRFDLIENNITRIEYILEELKLIYTIACAIVFFVNLFHFCILFQKELRVNLVYIVMIGVCMCDLLQALGTIAQEAMFWNIFYQWVDCQDAYSYGHLMVNMAAKSWQVMSRRCSGLFGLYIAAIRALSLMFPMNSKVTRAMQPKVGVSIMILITVLCGAWSSIYFVKTEYRKVLNCYSSIKRPEYVLYRAYYTELWKTEFMLIDGYMAISCSIFYVLVAIPLAVVIVRAEKRGSNLRHEKSSSNTSKLVITMAVSVFISEFIYGALYVTIYYVFQSYEEEYGVSFYGCLVTVVFRKIFKRMDVIVLTLLIINSIVHFLLCFFMSSQYRESVVRLVWRRWRPQVRVGVVVSVSRNS